MTYVSLYILLLIIIVGFTAPYQARLASLFKYWILMEFPQSFFYSISHENLVKEYFFMAIKFLPHHKYAMKKLMAH